MFTIKNKEISNLDKQYKRNCEAIQSLVKKKRWIKYPNIIKELKVQISKLSQENKELKAKKKALNRIWECYVNRYTLNGGYKHFDVFTIKSSLMRYRHCANTPTRIEYFKHNRYL